MLGEPYLIHNYIGLTRFISIRSGERAFAVHEVIVIGCDFSIGIGGLLYVALSILKIRLSLCVNISLDSMDARCKEVLSFYARILTPFHVLRRFSILKCIVASFICSNIHFFNPIFFTRINTFIRLFGWIDLLMCCPLFI